MERLKIAITGASGFIGSNLTTYFAKKGHEAVPLVRKNSNLWRLSNSGNSKFVSYIDIANRENTLQTIRILKPDVILHAASWGVYTFEADAQKTFSINFNGTINLLDAGIASDVPLLINTGSVWEYGPTTKPISEKQKLNPDTNYSISKALASQYCTFMGKKSTKTITLRLFTPFGYYEEKSRLFPYLMFSLIKGTEANLSDPSNVRDFIFIEDVMRAYELAIKKGSRMDGSDMFNIGSGKQHTVGQVVNAINGVSKKKLKVKWGTIKNRPGDDRKVCRADNSKAKKELGWRPETNMEDGIVKTLKWMQNNIDLYEDDRNDKSRR
jgi:nucleoside-diphosphate-sugar epimerase